MAEWLVQLKGHKFDLQYLATTFDAPRWRILEKDGSYYLQSSDFVMLTDSESIRMQALSLISFINGAAKVEHGDYQFVEVDTVIRVDEDGTRQVSLTLSGKAVLRSQFSAVVIKKDGTAEPTEPPRHAEFLIAIADQDTKVKEALRIFGALEHNWINLHKVFEIVQSDVGGWMHQKGWVTKGEMNRFTQTANSALAIGDEARHPINKKNFRPPKKPMTLSEAKSFIRTLLSNWIRLKGQ